MEKKKRNILGDYLKRSDTLLLGLCIAATVFGIVLIASATRHTGSHQYIYVQLIALILGIFLFFLFSVIDLDILADHWKLLFIFSVLLIGSLVFLGVEGDTGNRAWIRFAGIGVQPAEVVKIPFIILLAKFVVHAKNSRGLNHPVSVIEIALFVLFLSGLIIVVSRDLGSALVYLFVFIVVMFAAGTNILWFLFGAGAVAAAFPLLWEHFLSEGQKNRILAPYDPSVDPTGLGITWQANQSKAAISGGGFLGQGLFSGNYTQAGSVSQQHTDFIFSVVGEELGFIGCAAVILLLLLIILRCIQTGVRSNDPLGMLVSIGFAAMLIFQTFENIGMCIGLTPVIGLTLPFFSYGGSSLVMLYAAMGIVSGVKMRPKPASFVRQF